VSQQTGIYEEYPLRDALGSVRQMTDQSSAITGYKSYEPYGEVLSSAGQDPMSYGYAGEWTDASGMQYLRARYYDPSVGRFISRDSRKGVIIHPQSFNYWMYVYSNPINWIDPSGHDAECGIGGTACGDYGQWLRAYYNSESELLKESKIPFADFLKGYEAYTYYESRPDEAVDAMLDDLRSPTYTPWGYADIYADNWLHYWTPPYTDLDLLARLENARRKNDIFGFYEIASIFAFGQWFSADSGSGGGCGKFDWIFGSGKSIQKWERQMVQRGWTIEEISETIISGEKFPANNLVNKNHSATRYVNPTTGKSIVVDDITKEVIHIGGEGFDY
jgi:RHS repeat-associated protein